MENVNQNIEKANEILMNISKGKMKRVYVDLNQFPVFKNLNDTSKVGNFIYGGENDNNQQVWLSQSIEVVLSERENQVYTSKLNISEASVRNYRNKITQKGL